MARPKIVPRYTNCHECGKVLHYNEARDPLLFRGKKLCRKCLCKEETTPLSGFRESSLAGFANEPRVSGTVALNNQLSKQMKKRKWVGMSYWAAQSERLP